MASVSASMVDDDDPLFSARRSIVKATTGLLTGAVKQISCSSEFHTLVLKFNNLNLYNTIVLAYVSDETTTTRHWDASLLSSAYTKSSKSSPDNMASKDAVGE